MDVWYYIKDHTLPLGSISFLFITHTPAIKERLLFSWTKVWQFSHLIRLLLNEAEVSLSVIITGVWFTTCPWLWSFSHSDFFFKFFYPKPKIIVVVLCCLIEKKAFSHRHWTRCYDLNWNNWIKTFLLCSLTDLINVTHVQHVWTCACVVSIIFLCPTTLLLCSCHCLLSNVKWNKKHITNPHAVRQSVAPGDRTASGSRNFQHQVMKGRWNIVVQILFLIFKCKPVQYWISLHGCLLSFCWLCVASSLISHPPHTTVGEHSWGLCLNWGKEALEPHLPTSLWWVGGVGDSYALIWTRWIHFVNKSKENAGDGEWCVAPPRIK